jgi:hypothetical protein
MLEASKDLGLFLGNEGMVVMLLGGNEEGRSRTRNRAKTQSDL